MQIGGKTSCEIISTQNVLICLLFIEDETFVLAQQLDINHIIKPCKTFTYVCAISNCTLTFMQVFSWILLGTMFCESSYIIFICILIYIYIFFMQHVSQIFLHYIFIYLCYIYLVGLFCIQLLGIKFVYS